MAKGDKVLLVKGRNEGMKKGCLIDAVIDGIIKIYLFLALGVFPSYMGVDFAIRYGWVASVQIILVSLGIGGVFALPAILAVKLSR